MTDRDPSAEAARLVTQMDQAEATFAGIGRAFGKLWHGMTAAEDKAQRVPRHVAVKVMQDVAREWAAGTFGKGRT